MHPPLSTLEKIVRGHTSSQRAVRRARIVLLKSEGLSQEAIAERLKIQRLVVGKWCARFQKEGLAGLLDAKGRGRPAVISEETREKIIVDALKTPAHQSRWSLRTMARHAGVSPGTVHSLWASNDIKPHPAKRLAKVGLFISPFEPALRTFVFCFFHLLFVNVLIFFRGDEISEIQRVEIDRVFNPFVVYVKRKGIKALLCYSSVGRADDQEFFFGLFLILGVDVNARQFIRGDVFFFE